MARGKKRSVVEPTKEDNPTKKQKSKGSPDKISHRCHQMVPGDVLALGEGDTGQLGLGEDILDRKRPAKVNIPDDVIQVCAGGMHTVCVTAKGEVYTFGCNDEGALGRDTSEDGSEMKPGKVELNCKVVMVSAGDSHTAALSDKGKVYGWGTFRDANGKMGLSSVDEHHKQPVELSLDHTIVKIVSGCDHLVCLTEEGHIFTCGCAEQGQLGRVAECFSHRGGRKGTDHILTPSIVRCLRHKTKKRALFSDVWTGQHFTFAEEKETKDIYGWGLNNYCQLGFKDMRNRFVPERIPSFSDDKKWQQIYGGIHHTVALDIEGKVHTLGRAEYGRLGLGEDTMEQSEPTLVPKLASETCCGIAAGTCVSLAVATDGSLFAWGMGTNKQLATGEEDDEPTPVRMAGKQLETRSGLSISAGGQHTVILAKEK